RRAGGIDQVCKAEVATDVSDRAGQRLRDGRKRDAEEGRRRQDDERGGEDARELEGGEAHTERAQRGELRMRQGHHGPGCTGGVWATGRRRERTNRGAGSMSRRSRIAKSMPPTTMPVR